MMHAFDLMHVSLPFLRIYNQETERFYSPPSSAMTVESMDAFIQDYIVRRFHFSL